ncbi:hypothetical protein [Streptomyces sp. NPDC126514]|uniref:hypothetical protein n=1 Tax=Streptomyces sp. NPDC126514 TaxID=3155210 RepID=UPI0033220F48
MPQTNGGSAEDFHPDDLPADPHELPFLVPESSIDTTDQNAYRAAYRTGILRAIASPEYVLLCRSDASQQYLDRFIDEFAAAWAERVLRGHEQWPPASLPPS